MIDSDSDRRIPLTRIGVVGRLALNAQIQRAAVFGSAAMIYMAFTITAAPLGAVGMAHADSDVSRACQALMHQPKTAFDGPNQAVQELQRVYGLDANRAQALVNQLIVLNKADPAGWRPSQTCFDLWHRGYPE